MLVTISGIDGSGKTELSTRLAAALRAGGADAACVKPRYACNDIVKAFCARRFGDPNQYHPRLNADLYINCILVDWLDLLNETLEPGAERVLVCDRYLYDTMAQAYHYGADPTSVEETLRLFPAPDLSVYLEIDPEQAHRRIASRVDPPMHHLESLENLRTLRDGYARTMERLGWRPAVVAPGYRLEDVLDLLACASR